MGVSRGGVGEGVWGFRGVYGVGGLGVLMGGDGMGNWIGRYYMVWKGWVGVWGVCGLWEKRKEEREGERKGE